MFEFRLKFYWSLFLEVQLTIFQHCLRQWVGAEQATSHYLNQWWPSSMTHICVTWPQWVKQSIHCHHEHIDHEHITHVEYVGVECLYKYHIAACILANRKSEHICSLHTFLGYFLTWCYDKELIDVIYFMMQTSWHDMHYMMHNLISTVCYLAAKVLAQLIDSFLCSHAMYLVQQICIITCFLVNIS